MLSFQDSPASQEQERHGNRGLAFPSTGADGSGSPPGLIFSWARMTAEEEPDDHGSDPASPRLWRPGSFAHLRAPSYPMSGRAQEIANGRQELMQLYEGMPESAYELSLKDLVEQKAAMDRLHPQTNSDDSRARMHPARANRKGRTAPGRKEKRRNDPKRFLLNISFPGILTTRPQTVSRSYSPNSSRVVCQNGDQSSKESGKHEHRTDSVLSVLKMKPSQPSDVSSSNNNNSKVSPKPCSPLPDSVKLGQHEQPSACHSSEPRSRNANRCSMCSGYTIFFKTNCQVCGKVYCSSCTKVAIEKTPKGQKCQNTCIGRSYSESDLEPQLKSCWPFLRSNKLKCERKTTISSREEQNETQFELPRPL